MRGDVRLYSTESLRAVQTLSQFSQDCQTLHRRRLALLTAPFAAVTVSMAGAVTDAVQQVIKTVTPVNGSTMGKDIIQLIIEDHNRGREMYRQYTSPHNSTKQKQLLAWHMIRESCVHSYKEEQVLYPAMRRLIGDLAPDDCLDAHQTLKHKLTRLTETHITDPNFDALLQDYMKSLLEHMHHEEDELLPQLKATEGVTPEYLMQLGRVFESAKLICPTRPHAWAPLKPPLNVAFGAAITPVDFMRDMIQFEGAPPL